MILKVTKNRQRLCKAAVHGLMTGVRGLGQRLVSRVHTKYFRYLKYLNIPGTYTTWNSPDSLKMKL